MPLETGTYISDLVPANPLGSDPLAYADDHLRLIKSTLQNTFPNIKGSVTATQENLNNGTPVGLIAMWSGISIPAGWALCNGATVARSDGTGNVTTPALRDRFLVGTVHVRNLDAEGHRPLGGRRSLAPDDADLGRGLVRRDKGHNPPHIHPHLQSEEAGVEVATQVAVGADDVRNNPPNSH